jgi:hypothetical protein
MRHHVPQTAGEDSSSVTAGHMSPEDRQLSARATKVGDAV